jgi:hypothetical protein
MFLFNSDEQPEEKFDRFFTNIHLENERAVWLWCSSKLRPQWERVVKCPVAIAMGLAELEVGQSKDEDVVSLAVHPFGRSKLTLEDIKQAMDLRPVDALPRLKPMGFGGDSATSLLRGLTGGSRPETAPSLQNIVCGVEVTIFHVPATATDEDPHIERHLLAVLAKVAHLGCWLPTVNLD